MFNSSLLPKAEVYLYKKFVNKQNTNYIINQLKTFNWVKIKYGDGNPSRLPPSTTDTCYTINNHIPNNFLNYLIKFNDYIEKQFGVKSDINFGFNYYPDGNTSLVYHQDDDCIGNKPMAILSIGDSRHIWFRDLQTKEEYSFLLEDGDLLIFSTNSQFKYEHCIKKENNKGERYSLCFRPKMECML